VVSKCLLYMYMYNCIHAWIVRTFSYKHSFRALPSAKCLIISSKFKDSDTSDSMLMTDRQFNRSCVIRLRSSFLIILSFEKERSRYSLSPSLTETFLSQFQRLEKLIPDWHSLLNGSMCRTWESYGSAQTC